MTTGEETHEWEISAEKCCINRNDVLTLYLTNEDTGVRKTNGNLLSICLCTCVPLISSNSKLNAT